MRLELQGYQSDPHIMQDLYSIRLCGSAETGEFIGESVAPGWVAPPCLAHITSWNRASKGSGQAARLGLSARTPANSASAIAAAKPASQTLTNAAVPAAAQVIDTRASEKVAIRDEV